MIDRTCVNLSMKLKTEQTEQKHVTMKKTNCIYLINANIFSQDVEKGAPFMILTTREFIEEPITLIPPKSPQ